MFVLYARAAAPRGAAEKPRPVFARLAIAGACLALVSGCAAPVPTASLAAAADPRVPVPPARYSSVTAPYTPQRPVDPAPWRERNERVAPQSSQ